MQLWPWQGIKFGDNLGQQSTFTNLPKRIDWILGLWCFRWALRKGHTLFMAHYALYMTSHPRFMTSQHSIQFISLLYLISNWIYLTTHPLHLCIHTQIIDHINPIVCMITQAQYTWHHVNTYDITSTLYDITSRYDIHIHCIHAITPRIPVIAYTVAELLLTVYWLELICNICHIKPLYVWHHMNSMWYHNHFYWHQKTVFVTSHPQYSWVQNGLYTT